MCGHALTDDNINPEKPQYTYVCPNYGSIGTLYF